MRGLSLGPLSAQTLMQRRARPEFAAAATYAQLGQLEEARAEAAEVPRIQPNNTIAGTARLIMGFKSAEDDRHYFDGMRKARLPEQEHVTPRDDIKPRQKWVKETNPRTRERAARKMVLGEGSSPS